jgi:MFS family permease
MNPTSGPTTGNLRQRLGGLIQKGRQLDANYRLFLLANVFLGFAACIDASTFNNYLKDVFQLGVSGRTILEFPRELPGFLCTVFVGLLLSLGDLRIAAVANFLLGVAMFALGIIPPVFGLMLMVVFFYSTGQHTYMPIANSIGMGFATDGKLGRKLGQISAANTAALVSGSLILLGLFHFIKLSYFAAFSIGALMYLVAAVLIFRMKPTQPKPTGKRWIFRKRYGRFYVLSFLYGARKQLFLTFGPWVIVQTFSQPVTTMTLLFLIVSVLGIFLKPWIGQIIDRIGERPVLGFEAFITVGVCLIYAFAADLLPPGVALVVICGCYIFDQSSNSVGMARATYLKKIAIQPGDISPTLSLGISIDHVASMFLPMLGGLVWTLGGEHGYKYVFIGGAGIAILNWLVTRGIRTPPAAAVRTHADQELATETPGTD